VPCECAAGAVSLRQVWNNEAANKGTDDDIERVQNKGSCKLD
jgi:hypothetical protein